MTTTPTEVPPPAQLLWLANTMAARMLVDAASDARETQLEQALRHWLPDADSLSLQLVAREVRGYLRGLSAAVDVRLRTYVDTKRAEPLPGCDGRI